MSKTSKPSTPASTMDPNKKKSLDAALSQIERQFGKGAIMRLNDRPVEAVPVISTGSLAIDNALGIGGLPKGRVIEIYGPEASGKCLTADTYVWSERGLETIAEVFARAGQEASCTSRITDVRDLNMCLINERNEIERIDALTHNNRRPVTKLTLSSGRFVKGTANHPLRVINDRGNVVWKNIADIAVGDCVVSASFGADNAMARERVSLISEDEARLIGYLVAEGTLGLSNKNAIRFSNWDSEVIDEYKNLMVKVTGKTPVSYDDNKEHVVHDTQLRAQFFEKYGLAYENSAGKSVPHVVRTASVDVQKAFLSALFEGDAAVEHGRGVISYASASETLVREVQLMLLGLGMPSSLRAKTVKGYDHTYWELLLGPSAATRFVERVGFRSARRAAQWDAAKNATSISSYSEHLPNRIVAPLVRDLRDHIIGDREFDDLAGDLLRNDTSLSASRQRLQKIVAYLDTRRDLMMPAALASLEALRAMSDEAYTFEEVVSVEDMGELPTFDVAMGKTHSFLANGVLSHNTTLTLQVIAECQRAGGVAAFVDAEHALDPVYAAKLGVNLDELLVSQPDTGEQALEIVDTLVNSGAVDLVVVDSVAALVPRTEIEGDMGDAHVGLQARLMSQALRKLTGSTSKSKTTVVFINQLRMKIGVMMPGQSPETTTGGNALKFYASVRIDIRRIGSVKKGDEIVGNEVKVKIVKNKMAPPFRQALTQIIFGEGISREGEIIEMGVNEKFIEKSGAWYSYNGERIGQGKENVRDFLKQNPDVAADLEKKIRAALTKKPVEPGVRESDDDVDED